MESLASIIVPVYKVEQFLPRCIDSVIGQTHKNLEIILVDDGSPDNCGKICDAYAEKDNRIKVIHKKNAGVSAARNTGLDVSSGDYVMFVDSDDYLALDAVETLYERLQNDGSDMVVGKHIDVYDDGSANGNYCAWMKDALYTKTEIYAQFGQAHFLPVSSCVKLYKKELFNVLRYPNYAYGEDMLLYFDVLEKCEKVSVVDKTIYFYYQRTNSVTHAYHPQRQKDLVETNLMIARKLWEKGLCEGAANWFSRCIMFAFWTKEPKVARRLLHQYFNARETMELLKRQNSKSCMQWLAVQIPFVKSVSNWLRKKGIRK